MVNELRIQVTLVPNCAERIFVFLYLRGPKMIMTNRLFKTFAKAFAVAVVMAFFGLNTLAQNNKGTLVGTVTDINTRLLVSELRCP